MATELLLDTHFLLWLALGSERMAKHSWVLDRAPWRVSPVSLLEIQFLAEIGRIEGSGAAFEERLAQDARFLLDEISVAALVGHAYPLTWTRDPFDRLLAAHSAARSLPLCTVDATLLRHHRPLAPELAARRR